MAIYYGTTRVGQLKFTTLGSSGTSVSLATPQLSIDSSTGVVTATVTQGASGYITAGSTSNTLTLSTQTGSTITPSTSQQTAITSGKFTTGNIYVAAIPSNYIIPSGNKAITSNGNGIDVSAYATVSVNVPVGSTINNQNKTITPTESQQNISADSGYTGLGTVTINAISSTYVGSNIPRRNENSITFIAGNPIGVEIPNGYYSSTIYPIVHPSSVLPTQAATTITPTTSTQTISGGKWLDGDITINSIPSQYIIPSGNKSIIANGTGIDVINYATVSVNVPTGNTISNQDKTVTPTESQQIITADSGYTGLGTVTVNAISSTYVGSGITQRNSNSLTASGATVTAPAGYYAASASKSVASGSATTPATTITANPTLSTTYTSGSGYKMTVSKTQSVTPTVSAGYISTGTAGTITVSGSAYVAQSAITNNTTLPSGSSSNGTINAGSYLKIGAGYYPTDRYYMAQAQTNGSVNNPVATKGTVSNHSITVTPSVSYTAGYISAGSKTGTAITVSASELVSGSETKTSNGTYDVTNLAELIVNVSAATPNLQNKTGINPSTSSQTITADSGYDGLSSVQINAISPLKSSTDITASGATVTVPAGYYSAQATKTISSGSALPPQTISGTSATVSTGTNTLTLTQALNLTPQVTAGYIASGTAANRSVSLRASITTKGTATITPGTSNQTIASGTYLTGTQTISGDANLIAGNIKSGVSIFGVTGTYTGSGGGSSEPQIDTKTITASNYPRSISFTSMMGEPKAFFLKSTSQISSSGSTTYYYIISIRYNGTNTTGSCFRIGSTRRVDHIISGYTWTYSGTTLTITSSASSRSSSPGAFNNGYELVYIY